MSDRIVQSPRRFIPRLSVDAWAVIAALLLAALVRAGVIRMSPGKGFVAQALFSWSEKL